VASDGNPTRHGASSEGRAFIGLAREVIRQLAVLIRNATLHDPSNKVFHEPMDRLRAILETIVRAEGAFDLECSGRELYANQVRVRMEMRSLQIYRYVTDELARRRLGGLRFSAAPDRGTLARFMTVFHSWRPPPDQDPTTAFDTALDNAEVDGIDALPSRTEEREPPADRRQRAIDAYQQTLDFIRECMTTLDSPAELNLRRAKRTIHRIVDLSYEEGEGFSLSGLAAIKSHNEYTFNHMVNVCVLAVAFGQRLGLTRGQLAMLGLAALYHDMGKLCIPLDILDKHGPLTDEEWSVMGNHCVFGARTLFPLLGSDPGQVRRILASLQHHLGHDAGGYPRLRFLQHQGLYVRIVSIVDAFDAMTTKRVYQKQYLPDECLAIMLGEAGTRFDPLLLKAFINCMGIFPVGSMVILSSGELAAVCEPNPDPDHLDRPTVKVISDADHNPVPPFLLDLGRPDQSARRILRCVDPERFGVVTAHYVL
jgi:HD-GYP domain-containing protein (c-di-GMP phosphodiesterase class II)